MVGALQYLTMTKPDIAYTEQVVSEFIHAPRTSHLYAVKRIYRAQLIMACFSEPTLT